MVDFLTRAQANAYRNANAVTASIIVEKAKRRSAANSTFLSHSSKDLEILPKVVQILEDHGASVYLDKKDPALPPYTNRNTAQILRDRISDSKKFVVLATENSKDSRWVPWELGLGDGKKGLGNVAVFPTVESERQTSWTSTEYIGIYNQIVFGAHEDYNRPIWMVWNNENNRGTELRVWLSQ